MKEKQIIPITVIKVMISGLYYDTNISALRQKSQKNTGCCGALGEVCCASLSFQVLNKMTV